jgi:hypothetical protein
MIIKSQGTKSIGSAPGSGSANGVTVRAVPERAIPEPEVAPDEPAPPVPVEAASGKEN